jgi:hypothetical protein
MMEAHVAFLEAAGGRPGVVCEGWQTWGCAAQAGAVGSVSRSLPLLPTTPPHILDTTQIPPIPQTHPTPTTQAGSRWPI